MATPPARTEISDTYPNPSNAVARTGLGKFWDYATGLLGATGNQPEARALLGIGGLGQCRLTKSGANLVLARFNGIFLTVNNVNCTIPSGGVSLAPTGLTVGTVYNIYAVAAAGVIASLEASTTAHATDTTSGMEIKSGDATRTLVGKVRIITGPAFTDTQSQRFVLTWFNRRRTLVYIASTGALSTGATTPQPLLTVEFLTWGDEASNFSTNGTQSNNTVNAVNKNSLGIDSTSVASYAETNWQAYANSVSGPAVANYPLATQTEGYHSLTALGWVTSGTGSWVASGGFELAGLITV